MNNFTYYNPTRIIFGKGTISKLKDELPAGEKVLLAYGGGSIKRNGVYDQVIRALQGWDVVEFSGIEPNPHYETLMKAVEVVQRERIKFLLAVGGGSVIDGIKFVAAAVCFEGADPWDILANWVRINAAMPLGVVLTLPATGSESNGGSVISRVSTQEKLSFGSDHVYPRFAILDPETTYSLPAKQVRNGIVDAYIHVAEQYMTYPVNSPLQDRQAEAIFLTLIEEGPLALSNPTNYDARANLVWSATQGLNNLISCGVPGDWSTHMIGHELTAFYGLDHAETLAIIMPALWRHQKQHKSKKLAQYARRVWGLDLRDEDALCEAAVQKTEEFFHQLGMPTHLSDFNISAEEAAGRVRERFARRGTVLGEHNDITPEYVAEILRSCR